MNGDPSIGVRLPSLWRSNPATVLAPAVLSLTYACPTTGEAPVEAEADAGTATADPQKDFRFQFRLFHGLTPETDTSCFYFWSVANGYRQNEPEATEQLSFDLSQQLTNIREDGSIFYHGPMLELQFLF